MSRFRQDPGCDRTREWASLALDGELSQIERVLLKAHLRRCEECSRATRELWSLTTLLREAPLEQPERTFELPARRSPRKIAFRVAFAASLTATAAALGVFVGSITGAPARHPAGSQPQLAFNEAAFNQNLDMPQLRTHIHRHVPQRLYPYGRQGGV